MKSLLCIALLLMSFHYAVANDDKEIVYESHTSEPLYEPLWHSYKTDDCFVFDHSNKSENKLRDLGFRRCNDNSISYVQPDSRGVGGWEGKCGQTFAANAMATICQVNVDPDSHFDRYFSDITPGVRPNTLRKGLARVFGTNENCPERKSGNWTYMTRSNSERYIAEVKSQLIPNYSHIHLQKISRNGKEYYRNPVAALIQNPGGNYLHWVTIIDQVDINNQCHFVVNHWDNQYTVPCESMASWSYRVGRSYPIILKSYALVVFK